MDSFLNQSTFWDPVHKGAAFSGGDLKRIPNLENYPYGSLDTTLFSGF